MILKEKMFSVVLGCLIEAASDKNEEVKSSVAACIRDLAKTYADEVLQTICTYRKNHPKMSTAHTATLLRIAEQVCKSTSVSDIDQESSVTPLVNLAVAEMTHSTEIIPYWQLPASQLLVALGRGFCSQVMEGLFTKFQPGIVPHYFVLHTLGSLAVANAYEMVPYMKTCLGTMLPMMGALRSDTLKQAFAYVLGRFADAIQDYLANLEQVPDKSVTREAFSTELGAAMGVLLGSWLPASKDHQMLENVLHATAAMYSLLPTGRAVELAPRLIPSLLGLRRRTGTGFVLPLAATSCLACVLAQLTAETAGSVSLEPSLDNLMSALSDLVFEAPDLEQPLTIKNHYEALRCFDTLASRFPDQVSSYLALHLKDNNEKERARALVVLAHLVSCDHAENHLPDLITSVRSLVNDRGIKVRRAVVKVIVALAHKGYLKGMEGVDFLLYIASNTIVQPQIPNTKIEQQIEKDELRQVCCDSLVLLSSAVPHVAPLMKPLVLQCLLQYKYAQVSGLLARCINCITTRCEEEEECIGHSLDEALYPDLKFPNGLDVFARCLVMLGSPLPENGIHILYLLKSEKSISLQKEAHAILTKRIPLLIDLIQGQTWDENQWNENMLELVRDLTAVEVTNWVSLLSNALVRQGQQLLSPQERHVQLTSLACLAVTSGDNKLATMVIQDALDAARLFPGCEQVCATAIAECACGTVNQEGRTRFLQLALSQLRLTAKDLPICASSSISAASKLLPAFLANIGAADRSRKGEIAAGSERLRMAILLSYGELARKVPGVELLSSFESSDIVEWILQQLQMTKDDAMRYAALKTLDYVAKAFYPSYNSGLVVLEQRMKALTSAVGQLALGKLDITVCTLSLVTSLISLPPQIDTDSRLLVLKSALDKVLENVIDLKDEQLLTNLEQVCSAAMLQAGVTPASLDELVTLLEPWLRAPSLTQRTSATSVLAAALLFYVTHLQFGYETPSSFSIVSSILSRSIPRCTDLSPECRGAGLRCVRMVLLIASCYEGRQSSDVEQELETALGEHSPVAEIYSDDPILLHEATVQLAKVICCHLPPQHLGGLVEGLVMMLTDPEPMSCAGITVVLNAILKEKGGTLFHHAADILVAVMRYLPQISTESLKTGVLQCVVSLAKHHPKPITITLMNQPLPYSLSVQSCWQILARDKDIAGEVCSCLLSLINSNPLCEEPRDKDSPRVALPTPLAAVSGMHEMFACGAEAITGYATSTSVFPEVLSSLLLVLGGLVGACPPVNMPGARLRGASRNATASSGSSLAFVPNRDAYNLVPGREALESLRSFLICTQLYKATECLDQCSHVDTGENLSTFSAMVPKLIRNVIEHRPECVGRLVTNLNQHAGSNAESARITVVAVLSELVMWSKTDAVLLENILQQLSGSLDDNSTVVRQLALQGLSHVAKIESHKRNRYTSMVLVALLQGLDDSPGEGTGLGLAQEALIGLASILPLIDAKQVLDLQASLALRIRPFFTKENTAVRTSAFETLGELCKCGKTTETNPAFTEQLTSSLINLLLGLCDTNPAVVQACKNTLRYVAPLLNAEHSAAMVKEHIIDEGHLQFPQFASKLVKIMAKEMPDQFPYFVMTSLGFTRSPWPSTRASAALLTGLLYGSTSVSQLSSISLDSVSSRLTQLLTDPNPSVRASAASAIGHIFSK